MMTGVRDAIVTPKSLMLRSNPSAWKGGPLMTNLFPHTKEDNA
jgi:hypothetical protein